MIGLDGRVAVGVRCVGACKVRVVCVAVSIVVGTEHVRRQAPVLGVKTAIRAIPVERAADAVTGSVTGTVTSIVPVARARRGRWLGVTICRAVAVVGVPARRQWRRRRRRGRRRRLELRSRRLRRLDVVPLIVAFAQHLQRFDNVELGFGGDMPRGLGRLDGSASLRDLRLQPCLPALKDALESVPVRRHSCCCSRCCWPLESSGFGLSGRHQGSARVIQTQVHGHAAAAVHTDASRRRARHPWSLQANAGEWLGRRKMWSPKVSRL